MKFCGKLRSRKLKATYANIYRLITERVAKNYLNKNKDFKDLLKEVKN